MLDLLPRSRATVRRSTQGETMKLTSDAVEVVNRNALVTVALNQGYNAYLPVYYNGIDLILLNEATGDTKLVQLKGRWTIDKKYIGRNIWVAFPDRGVWYVAPHDEMLRLGDRHTGTDSWAKGTYSKSPLSKADREELASYRFGDPDAVMEDAAKLAVAG
jgi:hypothetical protein